MRKHGLDPYRYGFFCYDKWDEATTILKDATDTDDAEIEITPAGDRFAVRYDELAMFIAAAQEQRLAAIEAHISARD
jgi:hypothetical protein